MPELDWISVKGFKSIASIEKLKLGAINVVIGANGRVVSISRNVRPVDPRVVCRRTQPVQPVADVDECR